MTLLEKLRYKKNNGQKSLAILIDPDQHQGSITHDIISQSLLHGVDLFLVGGSLVSNGITQKCVADLKKFGAPHVVLFPGNEIQLAPEADALLFMSLISGRNPEYLIGKQVIAAPWVKKHQIETLPTGYMLVESGKLTSALYISGTLPLPNDKPDIAAATAMAGEMLGMKILYLDAGSGAQKPVPQNLIKAVNKNTESVLFVGGGIKSQEQAVNAWLSGADIVVVGNGIFESSSLLQELCVSLNQFNEVQL